MSFVLFCFFFPHLSLSHTHEHTHIAVNLHCAHLNTVRLRFLQHSYTGTLSRHRQQRHHSAPCCYFAGTVWAGYNLTLSLLPTSYIIHGLLSYPLTTPCLEVWKSCHTINSRLWGIFKRVDFSGEKFISFFFLRCLWSVSPRVWSWHSKLSHYACLLNLTGAQMRELHRDWQSVSSSIQRPL